jgi:hypothetical protein
VPASQKEVNEVNERASDWWRKRRRNGRGGRHYHWSFCQRLEGIPIAVERLVSYEVAKERTVCRI